MKIKFLVAAMLLLVTINCMAQATKIKQAEQKKASTKPPTAIINPVVKKDSLAKASSKTQPKKAIVNPAIQQKTTKKEFTLPARKTSQNISKQNITIKADSAKANLLDAFISLMTDMAPVDFTFHSYNIQKIKMECK